MPLNTVQPDPFTPLNRLHALLYSTAILTLLHRHITSISTSSSTPISSGLFLADLLLVFSWVLSQAMRWRPVRRSEHTDQLLELARDLPRLDVFICTADPLKEPPMTVVSTVLSVMAFDYPPEKLSVYVSDDGGSEFTMLALMEAAEFAKYWLPFCRENKIEKRSPEAFFESDECGDCGKLKNMYHTMKEKVERAMAKGYVSTDLLTDPRQHDIIKKFNGFTRRDHPSVIQVLAQSTNDSDVTSNPIPNLIYVSREKRPDSPHHFKAGALNALLRVSATITDAPVILTLDCDMYSNDPQTPHRALCYFLDPHLSPTLAFVQFPQRFQGINMNDIYASEIKRVFRITPRGMDGLRGPSFLGTGCFFARCSFFGPPSSSHLEEHCPSMTAEEVVACEYERGTKWGSAMGFLYGSLVEDYFTGYQLHCEGWRSVFCDPERAAFLGDMPRTLYDLVGQCMRWTIGLLEVGVSRYSPLMFGVRRASPLVGMCYAYYAFWGLASVPVIVYALVPQLALIYDVPLFPKISDPWFYLYAYLFLAAYAQDLIEFLRADGTIQRWWSDQRMWNIRGLTSFAFGSVQFVINQMDLSTPGFSVTSKVSEEGQNKRYEKGLMDFGAESPFFVPLGIVAIVNLSSLILGLLKAARKEGGFVQMFVQLFLSAFAVANCWPVIEAMFVRRDEGKIPRRITNISIMLAGVACSLGYFAFAH